jgi:hypothetical protein
MNQVPSIRRADESGIGRRDHAVSALAQLGQEPAIRGVVVDIEVHTSEG